jgi:hypothetical protein
MKITLEQAIEKINAAGHHTFGVVFRKKNHELRTMSCRRKVTKGVTGKGLKFDPAARNLMPVYDMNVPTDDGKGAFRMINLATLQSLTTNGESYEVL